MSNIPKAIITTLIILISQVVASQKVALVLSGGGAKGAAHIGVIRALEEEGIPIDYIAGTSAGAFIGGLYAAGYSIDEIENLLLSPQLANWSTGEIEDKYTYYFKVKNPNPSWIKLKFDWDSILTPSIPINLISPYQMDFGFLELFAGANAVSKGNFDSLFIPFRCIATNLKSNEGETQRNGSLCESVRASMTFPFYFRPITINGNVMYDGGMKNNFPADVADQDFNPDIIIGSKVATGNKTPRTDDIVSILENMLMANNKYQINCENGVLIEPKVEDVNVINFSKTMEFIQNGYSATKAKIPQIRLYVKDSIPRWNIQLRRQEFKKCIPPLVVSSIKVNGLKDIQNDYINKLLTKDCDSSKFEDIKAEYFKLISDDKLTHIYPRLIYNPTNKKHELHLDVEKDKSFEFLFGGNLSSNAINTIFTELRYKRLGIQGLNLYGNAYLGKFYNSALVAVRMDYPQKKPFYQEVNIGFNQFNYFNTSRSFFGDEAPSYLIETENFINFNIGFPATNKAKWEFGISVASITDNYFQSNTYTRNDLYDVNSFDLIKPYIQYDLNTQKNQYYSNQGVQFISKLYLINGKERNKPGTTGEFHSEESKSHNWLGFRTKYINFVPYNKRITFGLYVDLSLTSQNLFATYTASKFRAPQFNPIPEVSTQFLPTFRDYNFFAIGLKTIYKINKTIDFRFEGYYYQPISSIKRADNEKAKFSNLFESQYFILSTIAVYNTRFGPLSLSLNYQQKSQPPFSVNLNFGYVIFNRRVME
ncbi:MAG: patatin-like phospholipase family protein [Bacteroidota bacterium]